MTKCVSDLAWTLEAMVDERHRDKVPKGGYAGCMVKSWEGIRVGVLKVEDWPQSAKLVGKDEEFVKQQVSYECVWSGGLR